MTDQAAEPNSKIVIYQSPDGATNFEVTVGNDTVWLSQRQMAELFEVSTDNVGLHIKNAYQESELSEMATTEESSVVQIEGGREVKRQVRQYNLDVIISVGYRVIFVLNCTNGPGYMYIPTPESYTRLRYQAWQTLLAAGALEKIIAETSAAISKLPALAER